MRKNRTRAVAFLSFALIAMLAVQTVFLAGKLLSRAGGGAGSATTTAQGGAGQTAIALEALGDPTAQASNAPYYGAGTQSPSSSFTRVEDTTVPNVDSEEILIQDLNTGTDIAAVNENERWPTASLTKLMTATVALDHLSMDTQITITPQMMAVDPAEEHLVVNGTYSVYDLLHVLLMPSSNVAAEALADYYGRTQFLAEMNARAQAWGMTDTYFNDPSGLSSANESTAHDLAILAQHVYESYPTILSFTDTPDITITNYATGGKVDVKSINEFAGQADFIGGKTGYIPEAEDNLLSIFRYRNSPVLVIVLGARNTAARFTDTTKLLDWFESNYQ